MSKFQEAYRGLEDAIDGVIKSTEGVPAHIVADVLQRRADQQRKLAEASAQEGAGQIIKQDPVNQQESAARASSPTDAAPINQAPTGSASVPAGADQTKIAPADAPVNKTDSTTVKKTS